MTLYRASFKVHRYQTIATNLNSSISFTSNWLVGFYVKWIFNKIRDVLIKIGSMRTISWTNNFEYLKFCSLVARLRLLNGAKLKVFKFSLMCEYHNLDGNKAWPSNWRLSSVQLFYENNQKFRINRFVSNLTQNSNIWNIPSSCTIAFTSSFCCPSKTVSQSR